MNDEVVSVAIRLKFSAPATARASTTWATARITSSRLFMDNALTFSATPARGRRHREEGDDRDGHGHEPFRVDRDLVAVMGATGTCTCLRGDKVAEGNGMVNELNGFIRDVTTVEDNYVGTCYIEDSQPLSAGIITVDVFDGEMNDLASPWCPASSLRMRTSPSSRRSRSNWRRGGEVVRAKPPARAGRAKHHV